MRIKIFSVVSVVCCLAIFNGEAFARGGGGGGGSAGGSMGAMTRSAGETGAGRLEQHKYINQEKDMDQDRDRAQYKDADAEKDTAKAKAKAKETKRALSGGKEAE